MQEYDPALDILTVRFTDMAIQDSAVLAGVIVDYDAKGRLVGFEILDATRNASTVAKQISDRVPLPELARVTTRRDVRQAEKYVPAGSTGIIVHVWDDGQAYEVEFFDPINEVLTVEATDVLSVK